MTTAIRYFSKFGHTKQMADVVGKVTGAKPETTDVPVNQPVDVLYLGSGVMLGKISSDMTKFIKSLTPDKVKCVVCFGSCAIIKSPVPQMRSLLEVQGITVSEKEFTCKGSMGPLHAGHPNQQDLENLCKFIKSTF